MLEHLVCREIDLVSGTPESKKREIMDYFLKTWEIDEILYKILKSEDVFYRKSDKLRHIILFYYGHTAAFYINKLVVSKLISERVNPAFESIFAIGVDEMSWDDLDDTHYDWPKFQDVVQFREEVKNVVIKFIEETPLSLPIGWDSPLWIIMMGIGHSRIHLETSSVLIRQIPINDVVEGVFGEVCPYSVSTPQEAPENSWVTIQGGRVVLGKGNDNRYYGWDNEYGTSECQVDTIRVSRYLISNAEFLEFIMANGYHTKEYWTEEGWRWKEYIKCETPLFWIKNGDSYMLRLIDREIDMPWDWPVEINYHEAKAYCNWRSKVEKKKIRLPTEAEYVRMRDLNVNEFSINSKYSDVSSISGNINLENWVSACPVDMFNHGDVCDAIGNVWQWSETHMDCFEGFKVHPTYDDFTVPTIDGKHNLIKGGSFISTGNEALPESRYAFRRHFYQHAGFRIVESEKNLVVNTNIIEQNVDVCESIEMSWSKEANFHTQLLKFILNNLRGKKIKRVLDINADTGRLPFELSNFYDDVTGLDFTARFIRISDELKKGNPVLYMTQDEGEIGRVKEIPAPNNYKNKDKILFMQVDPSNLKKFYSGYDLIIVPNLIEDVPYPKVLLESLYDRLNENGYLVISSTYLWDEKKTPKKNWLGGQKYSGETYTTLDVIKQILSPNYEMIKGPFEITFNARKSKRCLQVLTSEVTMWRKK